MCCAPPFQARVLGPRIFRCVFLFAIASLSSSRAAPFRHTRCCFWRLVSWATGRGARRISCRPRLGSFLRILRFLAHGWPCSSAILNEWTFASKGPPSPRRPFVSLSRSDVRQIFPLCLSPCRSGFLCPNPRDAGRRPFSPSRRTVRAQVRMWRYKAPSPLLFPTFVELRVPCFAPSRHIADALPFPPFS